MHTSVFIVLEDKLLGIARNDYKKLIALEIIHRIICLRFELRSTTKAPEVTKCQGL